MASTSAVKAIVTEIGKSVLPILEQDAVELYHLLIVMTQVTYISLFNSKAVELFFVRGPDKYGR